jgi:hypothetical protein
MKRKLIISLALVLVVCAFAFAQTRLRSRGASVEITSAGAVAITPFSGQSVAVTGPLTASGLITANGGVTLGTDDLLTLDGGTATATAGAATLNKQSGVITSEALTTTAAGSYTLTLTNSVASAASRVLVSVDNGTNTQGIPVVSTVTPGASSIVIKVFNLHGSQALNGTLKISYLIVR